MTSLPTFPTDHRQRQGCQWMTKGIMHCSFGLPENQARQNDHFFQQISFHSTVNQTLASNYILTVLIISLLGTPPRKFPHKPLSSTPHPPFPQFCFPTQVTSWAPSGPEHSDVFTNTLKVKNHLSIVMSTGTNMTKKDRLYDRTWL